MQECASLLRRNLENDPAVIYMLDRDLRIVYANNAWDRFAAENGGQHLERQLQYGRPVMDVIPEPLKEFFREGYRKTLSSRQPWWHSYECSSSTVFRTFRMMTYPDPESQGLVVVNSITVERLHDSDGRTVSIPVELVYRNQQGQVKMCCHCRRTSRVSQPAVWDWVPAYLEKPPEPVSHGICVVCMNLFYPAFADAHPLRASS